MNRKRKVTFETSVEPEDAEFDFQVGQTDKVLNEINMVLEQLTNHRLGLVGSQDYNLKNALSTHEQGDTASSSRYLTYALTSKRELDAHDNIVKTLESRFKNIVNEATKIQSEFKAKSDNKRKKNKNLADKLNAIGEELEAL